MQASQNPPCTRKLRLPLCACAQHTFSWHHCVLAVTACRTQVSVQASDTVLRMSCPPPRDDPTLQHIPLSTSEAGTAAAAAANAGKHMQQQQPPANCHCCSGTHTGTQRFCHVSQLNSCRVV